MSDRRIVVGIGGGIAAYKVAMLVSRLVRQGDDVHVVLTRGATRFIGAATFAALCGRSPVIDAYDERYPLGPHIELAEGADALLIAPATARILASCAAGSADDLLATLYLARSCPVLLAPAMSVTMWEQPAVQRNVARLVDDGVRFVGPESGWLSCRKEGMGRMAEPDQILTALEAALA